MLTVSVVETAHNDSRDRARESHLWHDRLNHTPSLGCGICADRQMCGGLYIKRSLYDCFGNCCHEPENCDVVCRTKPREFAQRVREVDGFGLHNVPHVAPLLGPHLPQLVPVLFHGSRRETPFSAPAICVSLYSIIARNSGTIRYADDKELADRYCFRRGTPVILTGTANDRPIERWWSLGAARLGEIRRLRDLGVTLVTTPNFSLFTDRPRWDDMHSMKRIAITHEEFLREGMPAALHVNARTERDWERWTEYILERREVTHVAFEFATGAGWASRVDWHADQLANLRLGVGRPLHLVVRQIRSDILLQLLSVFGEMTVLDSSLFMKTVMRQRAIETTSGRINWRPFPTSSNVSIDSLLKHNWAVVRQSYDSVFREAMVLLGSE